MTTREQPENDNRLLSDLLTRLPSEARIARLSESDLQDNIPCYVEEIEAALRGLATPQASSAASQAIAALRAAAAAGDIRDGVIRALDTLRDALPVAQRPPLSPRGRGSG
ncbi:hypothetical protein [Seohaeicola zhoushanensis]|uniref:Uncharacterized protein n=1 Tax=Seohaeicola zhoushanensis TaxID=1569283 RepID=A0A8J3MAX0_9RHOB|nr:hypothetical protein [Seohaeicola zhoushanensis]GHF73694.1 hypothetical protein GCM10017056_50610 [Seohaeicola zhoushanensis]